MPTMRATRTLRLTPDGDRSDAIANVGDKVDILEERDPWTKIRLLPALGRPEGWVSSSAVDQADSPAGPIDKTAFARECWRQGILFGANAHYLAAIAELRSRVMDQQTDGVGPFCLIQPEWDKSRTDKEFGLDFEAEDIASWRMQCTVFALIASRTQAELITNLAGKRPMGLEDRRPSALELYLAQLIGAQAAARGLTDPAKRVDVILKGVMSGDLPGGLAAEQLIQRHNKFLADGRAAATVQIALQKITAALQPALDTMRPFVLQAGTDVLDDPEAASSPSSASAAQFDLSSIRLERRPMAQRIINAFSAAGFGKIQQAAALANAIAESRLDPGIKSPDPENSFGLFQLNRDGGLGRGRSIAELKDPDTNINIIIREAKKFDGFVQAGSIHVAVSVFVKKVERPAHPQQEIDNRLLIAHRIAPTLFA
jgi:hypothetical protein